MPAFSACCSRISLTASLIALSWTVERTQGRCAYGSVESLHTNLQGDHALVQCIHTHRCNDVGGVKTMTDTRSIYILPGRTTYPCCQWRVSLTLSDSTNFIPDIPLLTCVVHERYSYTCNSCWVHFCSETVIQCHWGAGRLKLRAKIEEKRKRIAMSHLQGREKSPPPPTIDISYSRNQSLGSSTTVKLFINVHVPHCWLWSIPHWTSTHSMI